jgi:hypothetical protein
MNVMMGHAHARTVIDKKGGKKKGGKQMWISK